MFPSNDVIDVCLTCEKYFRQFVSSSSENSITLSNVQCHNIMQSVLQSYVNKPIFMSLTDHMNDTGGFNNHLIILIKVIAEKYLKVRYFYAGKQYTARMKESVKSKSRQTLNNPLNKLISFSGQ